MDVAKSIQVAVARADLILCSAFRNAVIIVLLALLVLATVLIVRYAHDPYWIDYDSPGVDITSEGPDGYTDAWYSDEWNGDVS